MSRLVSQLTFYYWFLVLARYLTELQVSNQIRDCWIVSCSNWCFHLPVPASISETQSCLQVLSGSAQWLHPWLSRCTLSQESSHAENTSKGSMASHEWDSQISIWTPWCLQGAAWGRDYASQLWHAAALVIWSTLRRSLWSMPACRRQAACALPPEDELAQVIPILWKTALTWYCPL